MNSTHIPANKFSTGGVADQEETFNTAYSNARNNKEELFVWKGNKYSTKNINETNDEYKQFLGVKKFSGDKTLLKNTPSEPAIKENLEEIVSDKEEMKVEKIVPKPKPVSVNKIESPIINTAIGLSQDKDGKYYIAHPLFDRMLEKESSRGTNLISPKGAVGLMQIIPDVHTKGDYVGFNVETKPTRKDLDDPAKNVAYAIEYYNGLKKHYGSDELALIAYNWGAGNLDKWIAKGKNPNDLPKETKDYVNYILNRKLFHSGGMAHTHGPKKSKPKKSSWKSLFTSNQAYGGPTPPVQSSSSSNNNNDNKEKYIASTKGGTTTKPPKTIVKSSNGGGDDKKIFFSKPDKKDKDKKFEISAGTNFPSDWTNVQEIGQFVEEGPLVAVGAMYETGNNLFPNRVTGTIAQASDGWKELLNTTEANLRYDHGKSGTSFDIGYTTDTNNYSANIEKPVYQTSLFGKPLTFDVGANIEEGKGIKPSISLTWGGETFKENMKSGGLLDRKRLK